MRVRAGGREVAYLVDELKAEGGSRLWGFVVCRHQHREGSAAALKACKPCDEGNWHPQRRSRAVCRSSWPIEQTRSRVHVCRRDHKVQTISDKHAALARPVGLS